MRTYLKENYLLLAFFLVLALLVTYPTIWHPFTAVPGDSRSDVWDHLWGYWRTEKAFFVEHQFPYEERHMNHPEGGVLFHVDLLNSFFMLPLRAIFGMTGAYNLLVWGHLVISGMGMYHLSRRFTTHRLPAVFAGVAFAFSPYMLALTLTSGVANRLNITWIPLFFLFYLKLIEEDNNVKNTLYASLMFLFATAGCWLYGLYVFMICALLSIFVLLSPLRKVKPQDLLHHYRDLVLKKMLPLLIGCGLAGIPIGLTASRSISSESSGIYQREHQMFWDGSSELQVMNHFGLYNFFTPNKQGLVVSNTFDMLFQTTYLGFALLFLGALSLLSRKRYSAFFFPCAIIFFTLALGPEIRLFRGSQDTFNSPVFLFFAQVVPYMTAHEVPWEFILPGIFCAGVASAMGIDWLISNIRSTQWKIIGGCELILVLVLENFLISPASVPVTTTTTEVPAFYYELADNTEEFAVFDFPTTRPNSTLLPTEYFYYQTIHKKPIPYAVQMSWLNTHQFWIALTKRQQGTGLGTTVMEQFGGCLPGASFGCGTTERIRDELAEDNFRYFVVHLRLIRTEEVEDYLKLFTTMFGEPYYRDSEVLVFQIQQ